MWSHRGIIIFPSSAQTLRTRYHTKYPLESVLTVDSQRKFLSSSHQKDKCGPQRLLSLGGKWKASLERDVDIYTPNRNFAWRVGSTKT